MFPSPQSPLVSPLTPTCPPVTRTDRLSAEYLQYNKDFSFVVKKCFT